MNLTQILKIVSGGLIVPILLFVLAMAADTSDIVWLERLGYLPFIAVIWPLFVFSTVFPPPVNCPSCGPTLVAVVASVMLDFVMYAALTHSALRVFRKWHPPSPQVIELNI